MKRMDILEDVYRFRAKFLLNCVRSDSYTRADTMISNFPFDCMVRKLGVNIEESGIDVREMYEYKRSCRCSLCNSIGITGVLFECLDCRLESDSDSAGSQGRIPCGGGITVLARDHSLICESLDRSVMNREPTNIITRTFMLGVSIRDG